MNISTGKRVKAQKIVIYGVEGIGKSEMASCFPEPIFIDTEGSTDHMDVSRLDTPTSWPMFMDQIFWISNPENHNFKTLVIDTIDWAERLCSQFICMNGGVNSIGDFSWGKGPVYLADEMGKMLDVLTRVINSGINVVVLGHTHIRPVDLPEETGKFDKYELRLEKKVAPLPKEWADAVFFCNFKTLLVGDSDKKKKAKGGRRTLFTTHHASYDAKNRYQLPQEIDFEGKPESIYESIKDHIPIRNEIQVQTVQQPAQSTPSPEVQVNEQPQAQKSQAQTETIQQEEVKATEEATPAQETQGSTAFSGPLYDLMNTNQVTEEELEALAVRNGHFPEGMKLGEFPQDYLDHLVTEWSNVHESIKQSRG
jgi:hypothetical protein